MNQKKSKRNVFPAIAGISLALAGTLQMGATAWGAASDWTYFKESDGVYLTRYNGPGGNIVCPEEWEGQPVVGIYGGTFRDRDIYGITLPSRLQSIPDEAFINQYLTEIHLPSSVKQIGRKAFQGSQLTSVDLSHVESVERKAFANCQLTSVKLPADPRVLEGDALSGNLLETVDIPGSWTEIPSSAFSSNRISSVVIPDGVTHIWTYAFSENQLTSVTIPASVQQIDAGAFADNPLATVVLEGRSSTEGMTLGENWNNGAKLVFEEAPPAVVPVSGIQCAGTLTLEEGKSAGLNAQALPANATDKTLSYTSGNPAVATVSADGTVTGVSAGSCAVTITARGGKNLTKTVNVTVEKAAPAVVPVSEIQCAETLTLEEGKTAGLNAQALPANATDKALSYTSGNPAVATVSADGTVTGVSTGSCAVTITARGGKNLTKTVNVTVEKAAPADVPVTAIQCAETLTLEEGKSANLNAQALPANATDKALSYTSGNPAVATVSADGTVTGVSAGSCAVTITARGGKNVTKEVAVTVQKAAAPDVPVSEIQCADAVTVEKGKSVLLHAKALPENAADKTLSYSSANPDIAAVSPDGSITGKKEGKTTVDITANGGGAGKQVSVTVTPEATETPEASSTVTVEVNGSVASITTLDVNVPVNVTFQIDGERNFISSPFSIVNHSSAPVSVTAVSLTAAADTSAKVVEAGRHTAGEWNNLSREATRSQIALGLNVTDGSGLLLPDGGETKWFGAENAQTPFSLGTLQSAFGAEADSHPAMALQFDARYGKAWGGDSAALRYSLVLTFGVA